MRIEDPHILAVLRHQDAEAEALEEVRRITEQIAALGETPVEREFAARKAESAAGLVAITVALSKSLRFIQANGGAERYPQQWEEAMDFRRQALASTSEMRNAGTDPITSGANDIVADFVRARFAGIGDG